MSLKLPALLHKFLEPLGSTLNSDTFFQKWNQLGGPPREVRQIIKAKESVDPNTLRERVSFAAAAATALFTVCSRRKKPVH